MECNTSHDWVGKVIHWEPHKRLKSYDAKKMVHAQFAPEIKTHRFFYNIEIQMDLSISDLVINNKKKKELFIR